MLADLDALPPTLSTEQLSQMLGCSRGAVWAAARDEGGIVVGDETIRPLKVGRALRWPSASIARALGVAAAHARDDLAPDTPPATSSPASESESRGEAVPDAP